MKKILAIPILLLFLAVFISCATFEKNTYRTMYIGGLAYDNGMKVVSKLQAQGQITLVQRQEINKQANYFYAAYHVAVDAFGTWKKTQTQSSKEALATALSTMAAKWATYANLVNLLVPGSLPPNLEGVSK